MIARASATWRDNLYDELVIDNFAGGGGAGLGIELALGRPTDHAINHDAEAIAMHRVNHPGTEHWHSDVWEVDPLEVTQGRPVGLGWFSPDCTYHSKARGGKPIRDQGRKVRALAWVVLRWAGVVRPRVIMLENVEEFADWGPLTRSGKRCRRRRGLTFKKFVKQLRGLGYAVEWRELRACDYGAPTIRKRLFLIARCDGQPIIWPEPTHRPRTEDDGKDRQHWGFYEPGDPGYGFYGEPEDPDELERERAEHERKYRDGETNSVNTGDEGGATSAGQRFSDRTDAQRTGDDQGPVLGRGQHNRKGSRGGRTDATRRRAGAAALRELNPYRTAAECIDWSIPCPSIFERKRPLADNTLKRIAAGIKRYVLDSPRPFLVSIANYGGWGAPAHDINKPLSTVTANPKGGHHAVCVPTLVQTGYGERPRKGNRKGQAPRVPGLDKPLGTVVAGGAKHALVAAFMAKHYGGMVGCPIDRPAPTQTCRGTQNQVVAVHMLNQKGSRQSIRSANEPLSTVCASTTHAGLVAALLVKYYGSETGGYAVDEPLHTIPTRDRYGLVSVEIDGETYVITDIGMRMLQPRELYRAQGFSDDYVIDYGLDEQGERMDFTKTAQVKMCGNSVSPPCAEALVRANVAERFSTLGNLAAVGGAR